MVTLASSLYTRPPSHDMDTLVGLLHTYVSLTLYSQATLFFANPLLQFPKSRIVSFFKDLSDVRYVLNLLVRLFHGLMILMLVEYLNCTNHAPSEFSLKLARDIHPNPGPVKNVKNLSLCHWNLNGINARDGIKIPLLEVYNSLMHFDLFALSETFLDTSVEEEKLFTQGFSKEIWRSDHPRDTKQGVSAFILRKTYIKRRTDLEIMYETIVAEISIKRKKIIFVVTYRSASQKAEDFHLFLDKLQLTLDYINDIKPYSIVLTGDFNCRSSHWWAEGTELPEGTALDELIESNNLFQLIDQPTHIRETADHALIR